MLRVLWTYLLAGVIATFGITLAACEADDTTAPNGQAPEAVDEDVDAADDAY